MGTSEHSLLHLASGNVGEMDANVLKFKHHAHFISKKRGSTLQRGPSTSCSFSSNKDDVSSFPKDTHHAGQLLSR